MKGDIFMSEGKRHQYIKNQILQELIVHPKVTELMQERDFGTVRPDISFCLGGKRCAVEVQHSNLSWRQIVARTSCYYTLGIYVLWLLHDKKELLEGSRRTIPSWQRCLHALYFGVIFFWVGGQTARPMHLEHCENPNERYHDKQLGTTFSPTYKYKRIPWFFDDVLITDLRPMTRKAENYGKYTLPAARLLNLSYEQRKQAREAPHSFLDERRALRHDDIDDDRKSLSY
jgi:hypothetical protein